ncbi:hypothetical protein ABF87_06425 [Nitrosomonas sp. JL21]|uniref:hypothetical protein n=1 Tax=Nitrosomonas sp. JL21 TaxID=153949 RepID=UPI00136D0727|nr:hypothetical protein [Nitrosomonas sp. JL21]MBL8496831.1 hypothetical protein [Nitrosomonas sp.]MBL8498417.1 hypothetical protein [Nitrosomonas sp.]MCC7091999.1 hypothetical protein [Nitrosomonas sp.]MXS77605.1 hypothetical protein [Nitrosomonas sp. JL21]
MKKYLFSLLIMACLMLPACSQNQTATEKIIDNANDALDRRPNEKLRDAAEDASDGVKGAGKNIKEAIKDATN